MKVGDIVYWPYVPHNTAIDQKHRILRGKIITIGDWSVTAKVLSPNPPYMQVQRTEHKFVSCEKEAIEDVIRLCQFEKCKAQRRVNMFVNRERVFQQVLFEIKTKVEESENGKVSKN